MVVVTALLGLARGAVRGFISGLLLFPAVWIVVLIITRDSSTAAGVGVILWFFCVLAGAGIGLAIQSKAEVDRQKTEAAEEAERRKKLNARLAQLLSKSHSDHSGLPTLVANAEGWLDRAARDFAERAFAPFWDDIEYAAQNLAHYQNGISQINRMAIEYQRIAADAGFRVAPFSLPPHALPDHGPTARRLAACVRKAPTDFQFATIYEQRKTNNILVAGFSTLASAIYQVGDAISSSLKDLSNNVHASLDELLVATREQTEQARRASEEQAEIRRQQSREAARHAAERRKAEREAAESQKRQEEMLDNIQRRRKPSP